MRNLEYPPPHHYTQAWQPYHEYIKPGTIVVSEGPNTLVSDPTLLEAAYLRPDILYVADPRSDSHPISEAEMWNTVGPIDMETSGNIDDYMSCIQTLSDVFVMNLRQPIWLGPNQGVLHIELPQQQRADVIMDRGTTSFVIADDDRYADIRESLLLRAFEADRSVLADDGVLILQTNHVANGYRKFPWEFWNISIQKLLLEAGFSSVAYFKVADSHIVPISDETAWLLQRAAQQEYEKRDLGLYERLSNAIKEDRHGGKFLEFSKKTGVGVHTKLYQDMYIATA